LAAFSLPRFGSGAYGRSCQAAPRCPIVDTSERSVSQPALENIAVPDALAAYVVEAARASDYDHLLLAEGGTHE
jgi:hypothetical protein